MENKQTDYEIIKAILYDSRETTVYDSECPALELEGDICLVFYPDGSYRHATRCY